MDKNLQAFPAKKVVALVVDLRASGRGDFGTAAEFAKRFCPKGKALFSLLKPAARQDRSFNSDRDPAFQGLIVALIDSDTAGGAEAVSAPIRNSQKRLAVRRPVTGLAPVNIQLSMASR